MGKYKSVCDAGVVITTATYYNTKLGDHTAISIILGSSWTMNQKGEKQIEGLEDKRQITAVLYRTLSGDTLPFQLIYVPGKKLPEDWLLSYTASHWSNEEKRKSTFSQYFFLLD